MSLDIPNHLYTVEEWAERRPPGDSAQSWEQLRHTHSPRQHAAEASRQRQLDAALEERASWQRHEERASWQRQLDAALEFAALPSPTSSPTSARAREVVIGVSISPPASTYLLPTYLLPSDAMPDVPCLEHNGRGWEVTLFGKLGDWYGCRFTNAINGSRYADLWRRLEHLEQPHSERKATQPDSWWMPNADMGPVFKAAWIQNYNELEAALELDMLTESNHTYSPGTSPPRTPTPGSPTSPTSVFDSAGALDPCEHTHAALCTFLQLVTPPCTLLLLAFLALTHATHVTLTVAYASRHRLRSPPSARPPAPRASRPSSASTPPSRKTSHFTIFEPELEQNRRLLSRCFTELTPLWLVLLMLTRYLVLTSLAFTWK
jgi:hypothetical protein